MNPIQKFVIRNFGGGGANEKLKPDSVQDNQAAPPQNDEFPLLNVHTDTVGRVVVRKGYAVYGGPYTSATTGLGLYQYRDNVGGKYDIFIGSAGATAKVYDISSPLVPVDVTGTASISDGALCDFATVAGKLIITTESRDTPVKKEGSANCATLGGTPPGGKYCAEFENYAFIANTSANPERVYWSALFDPESWTATDFKRLNGPVMGMVKRDNVLFIFTKYGCTVARATGDPVIPFTFEPLEGGIGLASNRSLCSYLGVIYWVAPDGYIYRMSSFTPEKITLALPYTIARINKGALGDVVADAHPELNQIWFAVPIDGSSVPNYIIAYDLTVNELFIYDNFDVKCLTTMTDTSGNLLTFFADTHGYVYRTNSGYTDYPQNVSEPVVYHRYTKIWDLNSPHEIKRIRWIGMTTNNVGNFSSYVQIIGDYGATGGATITLTHDGGEHTLGVNWVLGTDELGKKDYLPQSSDTCTTLKVIQLKLYGEASEERIFDNLTIAFQPLNRNTNR